MKREEEVILTITKELMLAMITSSSTGATKPSSINTEEVEKLGDSFKKLSKKVKEAYNELDK